MYLISTASSIRQLSCPHLGESCVTIQFKPVDRFKTSRVLFLGHGAQRSNDDDVYHQRSAVETAFFALKQRYTLRDRTWFGQFREHVLKTTVRNVQLAL